MSEKKSNGDMMYSAFIAGFRASSEGFNGEVTPNGEPSAWDDEIQEHELLKSKYEAFKNDK